MSSLAGIRDRPQRVAPFGLRFVGYAALNLSINFYLTVANVIDAFEDQPFGLTECSASTGV